MASHNNFSKKNRATKDSNAFLDPQSIETNNINNLQIKSFENVKEKYERQNVSIFKTLF